MNSLNGLIKNIDISFKQHLDNLLNIEELDKVIQKLPLGKSPSIDSLTTDFYRFFWQDLRVMLHKAFLDCISMGSLSNSRKIGVITLIPKPNKDILLLDNLRPITLLCTDYKILAHVFADRLNRGLDDIIDECQSAFIKGRNIHNHIRFILDLLDYNEFIESECLILFLDFYKAFDTLEHSFLLKALEVLDFGDYFCGIIRMLYNDISSAISLNPGLTPRFAVRRGIRQGCPISPKLLILATHFLALNIINNPQIQGIHIF